MQVIGASDSGKTTLIERLIPRLRARGFRVGAIKHAHHGFDMDRPGKDSWRHAQAGAEAVAVISPGHAAWVIRTPEELSIESAVEPLAGRIDLVLVEGFQHTSVRPCLRRGRGRQAAIRLDSDTGARLEIGTGACRVGVHPGTLLLDELEQIAAFCVLVLKEGKPCRPSAVHR